MPFDFLAPIHEDLIASSANLPEQALGRKIHLHSPSLGMPDLEGIKIALIGVMENRGAKSEETADFDFNTIRSAFHGLFPGNWNMKIADLGDIKPGASLEDTYFVVQTVVSELLKRKIIPVILGGSQDLAYPQYRAYDGISKMINFVNIDARFDLGDAEQGFDNTSHVSKMILEQPYNLFNYSNIGYQTYFNSQEEIDLVEKLYFDAYRLGEVSAQIDLVEPTMRDADMVNVDILSLSSSSLQEENHLSPNGFDGKEICRLARYAGISDKVSSFGIYELHRLFPQPSSAMLVAQIIWYFIEGVNYRKNEHTIFKKNQFKKYQVPVSDEVLTFYKSDLSERWWIEIPFYPSVNNKLKKHTLLPCTHQDYLEACNQEIPERWHKARRKNEI